MSGREFAKKLCIDASQLSRYESGSTSPTWKKLEEMGSLLQLKPHEVMEVLKQRHYVRSKRKGA